MARAISMRELQKLVRPAPFRRCPMPCRSRTGRRPSACSCRCTAPRKSTFARCSPTSTRPLPSGHPRRTRRSIGSWLSAAPSDIRKPSNTRGEREVPARALVGSRCRRQHHPERCARPTLASCFRKGDRTLHGRDLGPGGRRSPRRSHGLSGRTKSGRGTPERDRHRRGGGLCRPPRRCCEGAANAVASRNGSTADAHLLACAWAFDADLWSHDRDFAGTGWASWSNANLNDSIGPYPA